MAEMTINHLVQERIGQFAPSGVFTASDFTDLADSNTVRQVLSRFEKASEIQRIMRGVYYRPAFSQLLNEYEAPSPHEVAVALARRHHWTIAPSGNTALNLMGLSTQVSAKWSYISDGPYREFSFGNVLLEFRHRSNREISGLSLKSALVVQSLRALGKEYVSDQIVSAISQRLTDAEKEVLLKESMQVPEWIRQFVRLICERGA